MKFSRTAIASAIALCCMACVEIDPNLGVSLIPADEKFVICADSIDIRSISMKLADSLSGYSNSRITIGSVRDNEFGLTKRACALTLVPMYDTLDFGKNPKVKSFHFAAAADSMSVVNVKDAHILQNVNVYELEKALDPLRDYDCNAGIRHKDEKIAIGAPVVNGEDSLHFDFSKEYAARLVEKLDKNPGILADMDKYLEEFPGIYIETAEPVGEGGRINMFKLQLGFNSSDMYLTGNFARLTVNTTYDGWSEARDTSFYFYYGADKFYNLDSLLSNTASGNYPEYCLNVTSSEKSAEMEGEAASHILVEGGGGIKPVIDARDLRSQVIESIGKALEKQGIDPSKATNAIINKATIVLPFEFPSDHRSMYLYPQILSPTLRTWAEKQRVDKESGKTVTYKVRQYSGITDSSSGSEDKGDINRNPDILAYRPDVTYYLQSLLSASDKTIDAGMLDIWMLIQANEVITTTNESANDMSEYYQYLAYQSYYNNMYGGYGGYGYGGYGYGNDYYSNYYSYMMAAMYASGSSTTTSISTQIDKDRYYRAVLNGPDRSGEKDKRVPYLYFVFTIPATE